MRHHTAVAAVFGTALLAAACSSSFTAPGRPGEVAATADSRVLRLTNRTARPAFTFVIGREIAATVLWAPCVDAARCPPIAPSATRDLPYRDGLIADDEREALVHWWHADAGADGTLRPDSIRTIVVPLR